MNPLVAEYRALPWGTNHLPDGALNSRKREIVFALDQHANDPDVSQLLLEVLRDPLEYDLARIEAMKVVRIYVEADNPLYEPLWAEVRRIAEREDDEVLSETALLQLELREERGGI